MKPNELKQGDKVRVIKPDDIECGETVYSEHGGSNCWVRHMDDYDGTYTLLYINSCGWHFEEDGGRFGFLPEWLELVTDVQEPSTDLQEDLFW